MHHMGELRDEGVSEPVRCPACGHEVRQPEIVPALDPVTGRAEPVEGVQYRCEHCGFVFAPDEVRDV